MTFAVSQSLATPTSWEPYTSAQTAVGDCRHSSDFIGGYWSGIPGKAGALEVEGLGFALDGLGLGGCVVVGRSAETSDLRSATDMPLASVKRVALDGLHTAISEVPLDDVDVVDSAIELKFPS